MPSAWLFGAVAAGNLIVAVYLNTAVLTDEVYRSIWAGRGSAGQIEALLAITRHWELVGYVAGPIFLLARTGLTALLVQLSLLLIGPRAHLRHVFRAAVWAQIPLFVCTVAQALWLTLLPPAARTPDAIQVPLLTALSLPGAASVSPTWNLLLVRISLFDVAWVVVFALALEDRGRISGRAAGAAVAGTWLFITLFQWAGWLYLTGL
jgi:hypothetical protein